MTRYSIIVPVHNRAALTRQCLRLLLQNPPRSGDWEILVVDDASTDLTPRVLAEQGESIRVLTHSANMGFGAACNDAVALTSGEYLILLNNDTLPQAGWVDALGDYADRHPEAAMVSSKLLFPDDTIQHAGMVICQDLYPRHIYNGFPSSHPAVNKSRRYQAVTAACALVRRGPFEQAGGFDTAFRNGYEDVDLCLRLGESGYETHYCHESVLYHLEAMSRDPRGQEELDNSTLYLSRWAHRVAPDDFKYYFEDGLIRVGYRSVFPLQIEISPLLALVGGGESEQLVKQLLNVRSQQVADYMKDNLQLTVRLQEAQLQKRWHKH
jgi:GT2 family glycosyltransferase